MELAASIVLYKTDPESLKEVIGDFLSITGNARLYLIDNSPTDKLKTAVSCDRVEYIFNGANLGYGQAHNIGIGKAIEAGYRYHLVLNPDIRFGKDTIESIYSFMEKEQDIGQVMPKILYTDGSIQRLCKLLPTPLDLFGRRFFPGSKWHKARNERYELSQFNYDRILNTPCLSGCFMFLRTDVLGKSGLFDPRYFMYLEDFDLTRRIHRHARTLFFPEVSVVHGYNRESYRSGRLLYIHLRSAFRYFNKWGWVFDKERDAFNGEVVRFLRGISTGIKQN